MNVSQQLSLLWQLLKIDLIVYVKHVLISDIISNAIQTIVLVFVFAYIFPHLGLIKSYGAFFAVSTVVDASFFYIQGHVAKLVSDINTDKIESYALTLPLHGLFWYCKMIFSRTLTTGLMAIFMLPLIKLLLGNRLVLSLISMPRFIIIFVSINILISVIALLCASIIKDITYLSQVWSRILFPLWFLGCSQYSWQTLYQFSPQFAYTSFLNPFVYAYEGMHVAVLGQNGYLPFWLCVTALWFFIVLFGIWGFMRLKRWLDFV